MLMTGEDEPDESRQTITDGAVPLRERAMTIRAPLAVRKRLELQTLHSAGGIGEVWLAHDALLGREVALKRLKPEQGSAARNRARFSREARITGQLDHPGIVPVYDYSPGEDGRQHFYTMRFVRGRTFRTLVKQFHLDRTRSGDPLVGPAFLQLLRNFISVCETMAFAHSRRIIHRDLKGENIIVGDFGEVVVLDWGLAKSLDDDELDLPDGPAQAACAGTQTRHGDQLGTPAYMAPEQALGLNTEVGTHSDVHGLAAILYEILTGNPPYLREDVDAMIAAVIRDAPTPPHEIVEDVPPELEAVCLQGLEKSPDARPDGARALALEVQGWLDRLAQRNRTERERERFFRLSLDLLAIVDSSGRLVQSNPSWLSELGRDEASRELASFSSFLDPEHRTTAAEAFDAARRPDGSAAFDARMPHADGSTRWINWNVRSVENASSLYLVGRDVTQLVRSERRLRGLLEAAPDPSCVADGKGAIVLVNRTLEILSGYAREELIGQPVDILVPEQYRAGHGSLVAHYADDAFVRAMGSGRALSLQTKEGELVDVEISLGPMRDEADELLIVCSIRPVEAGRRSARPD